MAYPRRRPASRLGRACCVLLLLILCLGNLGCVRRRLTVRSNPPGALVFVDDRQIGVTPVSTPFTFYGTRKLQLFKDGYDTVTAKQKFNIPWYEIPVVDFFAENLWPFEIRDERVVDFSLAPQQVVPNERLVQRAQALRGNAQQGAVTPLWTTPPAQPMPAIELNMPPSDLYPQPPQPLPREAVPSEPLGHPTPGLSLPPLTQG